MTRGFKMDWVVTVPKSTDWSTYQKELDAVKDGVYQMNYRLPHIPKGMSVGDRCFIVYDGFVRGSMKVVGINYLPKPWTCTTTGYVWQPGWYVARSGVFTVCDPLIPMKGFRGIRKMQV